MSGARSLDIDVDVAIIGAGSVGLTLSCALAAGAAQLRIALIEANAAEADIGPVSARVVALSLASQRIFQALNVWSEMLVPAAEQLPSSAVDSLRAAPFQAMRVWEHPGWGEISFNAELLGEAQLGWIVGNRIVQAALWRQVARLPQISVFRPVSLAGLDCLSPSCSQLRLSDGRSLRSRLVVGADGAYSKVRILAGIGSGGWRYDQRAVVATVATEQAHQDTAWQHFLPSGPVAFLPLADGRCSIVWSTSGGAGNSAGGDAQALLELSEVAFAERLTQAFAGRLGAVTEVSGRASFPLRLHYARRYVKPGIALLGDAAHVVHPLAGQGVNLGLLDAAVLTEVILAAAARQQDFASYAVLRRYERWRQGDNALTLAALDGIKRLFSNRVTPLRLLRNIGLNVVDAAFPIKRRLAQQAMGLTGNLPRLAQNAATNAYRRLY